MIIPYYIIVITEKAFSTPAIAVCGVVTSLDKELLCVGGLEAVYYDMTNVAWRHCCPAAEWL